MRQNHSHFLFSQPMTYFGAYEHIEVEVDEEDEEEREWNFADSWRTSENAHPHFIIQQKIRLFIHWTDPR